MNRWLFCSAVFGFLGVATGAFGAHGLRNMLGDLPPMEALRQIETFKTAARYSLVHAVALLAISSLAQLRTSRLLQAAGWLFVVGTTIFSGTLWVLVLSGHKWLGAITPVGGTIILAGWVCLGGLAVTHKQKPAPEAVSD